MKTIHKISGIFLWCVVGVFLGKSVYTYYDYTAHPGLYETWSALEQIFYLCHAKSY